MANFEDYTHIALGIVINNNEILVGLRPNDVHQGGFWELPGGKVELGENPKTALVREMHEELGITVKDTRPLISFPYHYPDTALYFHVFIIEKYSGSLKANEKQPIKWQKISDLDHRKFPQANQSIINALQLPNKYLITGQETDEKHYLAKLNKALEKDIQLIQLRAKHLNQENYLPLANKFLEKCRQKNVFLILNGQPCLLEKINADGIHLTSENLYSFKSRPINKKKWLSAACHTERDIQQAEYIDADFITLSPVKQTTTHTNASILGWEKFQKIVCATKLPVYALGGLSANDIMPASAAGAQGVASIRAFWSS